MQEKAQPCASLWRKTLRPKWVRFLAIDVDYVCLPLYHLTFLPLYNLSATFREEKRKKKRDKRVQVSSINSWHESAVYRAALPHRYTILYNTQKSRYLKFRRASAPQWRDQALHTLVLMHSWYYLVIIVKHITIIIIFWNSSKLRTFLVVIFLHKILRFLLHLQICIPFFLYVLYLFPSYNYSYYTFSQVI